MAAGGVSPHSSIRNRADPGKSGKSGKTATKGACAVLVTSALPVAFYARVSTDRQAEAQTVASQVAAWRHRIASAVPQAATILEFLDEG